MWLVKRVREAVLRLILDKAGEVRLGGAAERGGHVVSVHLQEGNKQG